MKLARALTADGPTYGLIEDEAFVPITGDPFGQWEASSQQLGLPTVKLLNPVEPKRILVVLGGFLKEDEDRVPEGTEIRLFPKVVTNHLGPNAVIPRSPILTGPVEMEAEIALVVGRQLSNASVEDAWSAIYGYTPYNDVTAGEFVPHDLFRAKSLDGYSILGPWVSTDLTREDITDGLSITGLVNGDVCQSNNTSRFKFSPGEVLSHASKYVTLMPGDVIALGTPPPPYPIAPGDRVEAVVEGLGTLTNIAG
ncbi:fumarylacetoacetate hydrolase family protein [Rhodococcus sp. KBS0724]|uniref:fumarylacetoacetate hydrolase family protein n=1 Tax=Rhodococcus sp. KBS0724 TaxID=1179674 RepID=UPI00110EBA78|nr:fumarylacetoacetate hydrolase family protein [Rhodococcus sp. KBS0724]TSD40365.1 fumarylacetoacetate hydrolase family protein [Rhodococcus sp. KBS0724]